MPEGDVSRHVKDEKENELFARLRESVGSLDLDARTNDARSEGQVSPATSTEIHTLPKGDGWAVEREGSDRAMAMFETRTEAIRAGRTAAMADHVEHVIHNPNGTVGVRHSYRPGPFPA